MKKAIAKFLPNNYGISGTIYFHQVPGVPFTLITGTISGLTPGLHGFHVHSEGANILETMIHCKGESCCDLLGGHFNPTGHDHGYPMDATRHVGDLGNIVANEYGIANIQIKDTMIKLDGPWSVIGRSLIVHRDRDDGGYGGHKDSKTTGNSGPRLGCAIIELVKK